LVAFKDGSKYMQTEISEIIFMLPAAEYMASPRKFILACPRITLQRSPSDTWAFWILFNKEKS